LGNLNEFRTLLHKERVLEMTQKIEELLRQHRFSEAEAEARRLIVEHPINARAHSLLGLALFRQGQFPQAVESFQRATILEPTCWQSHLKLAQSLDRLQRYEDALKAAKAGLAIQPNDKELELLAEGLSRLAKPERTDGWEQSVHLDWHRVQLTRHD
jgi:Flp pilus assembly protein TadD